MGTTAAPSIIVIGYDPTPTGERALAAGVALAQGLGATAHVVTAFADGPSGGTEVTAQRRDVEAQLTRTLHRFGGVGPSLHCHAIPGSPVDAILRVTREQSASVVVIGNRGAQGARRVLGSIAGSIVAHAPCDVLVVKST